MRCRPSINTSVMPRHWDNPWGPSSELCKLRLLMHWASVGSSDLHGSCGPSRLLKTKLPVDARDPRPLAHSGVFQFPSDS